MVMGENLDEVVQTTQALADTLAYWAEIWKVTANAKKTKVMLITLNPRETGLKRQVSVTMGDVQLEQVVNARVLGVTMDEGMRFTEHVKTVAAKARRKLKTLLALRGTTWGRSMKEILNLYNAYILPGMEYGAATVATMASAGAMKPAEVVHRSAARIITGCTMSTKSSALMRESNMLPLTSRGEIKAIIAREKSLRLPDGVPVFETAKRPREPPKRKHSSGVFRETWCEVARRAVINCGLEQSLREPLLLTPDAICPPEDLHVQFDMKINDAVSAKDKKNVKKTAALAHISTLPEPDIQVWTDGSVNGETTNGGGGFTLNQRGVNTCEGTLSAGAKCSSFWAEARAMENGLKEVLRCCAPEDSTLTVYTDSRSVVEKLQSGRTSQRELIGKRLWDLLKCVVDCGIHPTVMWVPSHCGLEFNEVADRLADKGAALTEEAKLEPIPLAAAKAVAKRYGEEKWFSSLPDKKRDSWYEEVMGTHTKLKPLESLGVYELRVLAQLRVGKCPLTMDYLHNIKKRPSPTCPEFTCDKDDSVRHLLLECEVHRRTRRQFLGYRPKPDVLHTKQTEVIEYLSAIGRLRQALYPPDGGAGASH